VRIPGAYTSVKADGTSIPSVSGSDYTELDLNNMDLTGPERVVVLNKK
jgi:hypothetical protein